MSAKVRLDLMVRRAERPVTTSYASVPNVTIHEVVGVELAGFSRVNLPGSDSGPLSRTSAVLDEEIAKRIVRFAWGGPLRHRGDYDCHSFIGYACGWWDQLIMTRPTSFDASECTHPTSEIGQPYIIYDDASEPAHSLLGWRQHYSLSVLGILGPFAICSNEDLLRVYGPKFCRLLNMY